MLWKHRFGYFWKFSFALFNPYYIFKRFRDNSLSFFEINTWHLICQKLNLLHNMSQIIVILSLGSDRNTDTYIWFNIFMHMSWKNKRYFLLQESGALGFQAQDLFFSQNMPGNMNFCQNIAYKVCVSYSILVRIWSFLV